LPADRLPVNLPNQITTGRLALAVILFVLLETVCRDAPDAARWAAGAVGGFWWYAAFALYIVTVLTDGLDGYLARSRGQITAFGRIVDPLADKIVICGVLVLGSTLPQTRALVPTWIVLLVLAREFLVSGLRGFLEGRGAGFPARWEGKAKLMIQAWYCGGAIFYPGNRWRWCELVTEFLLWATLAITVWSAVSYVRSAAKMIGSSSEL
jgi:CDP-diacylglycerol--glycerol-3-phosphate 3-phosphatidyltransferase